MLNECLIKIRVDLQNQKLKKSGKNKFVGFDYYELSDFLPKLNELMKENEVNDIFTIENNEAILKLIYKDETNLYKMPFYLFDIPKGMTGIQNLGALNTYYKRYLYLNAFGITDGEVIDALDNSNIQKEEPKQTIKCVDKDQIQILEELIKKANADREKFLIAFQIKDLKDMPQINFVSATKALNKKIEDNKKEKGE